MSAFGVAGIYLAAIGVFAMVWILASQWTGTAKKIYRPLMSLSLLFRFVLVILSLWVALTAGGIAAIFGLIAVGFISLHMFMSRPDQDVGIYNRAVMPGPALWVIDKITGLQRWLSRRF